MKAFASTVIAAHLALAATACSSIVTYSANGNVASRAARDPSSMVVMMQGEPAPRAYVVSGKLHASSGDTARSLELLRKEAARNGLDGVVDVVCAPGGARDEGSCDANGFVYR